MLPQLTYFESAFQSGAMCTSSTHSYLENNDDAAKSVWNTLDEALLLTEKWATLPVTVQEVDHFFYKKATIRTVSNVVSAIRLALLGHYDESLIMSRVVGETANLMRLFAHDPEFYEKWKKLPEAKRMNEFNAGNVRLLLERFRIEWMDKPSYAALSGKVVHLTPDLCPQQYDEDTPPNSGGRFQRNGFRLAVFWVAVEFAGFMNGLSTVTFITQDWREAIDSKFRRLNLSIPGMEEGEENAMEELGSDNGKGIERLIRKGSAFDVTKR